MTSCAYHAASRASHVAPYASQMASCASHTASRVSIPHASQVASCAFRVDGAWVGREHNETRAAERTRSPSTTVAQHSLVECSAVVAQPDIAWVFRHTPSGTSEDSDVPVADTVASIPAVTVQVQYKYSTSTI